jgi:hypothetical protein
MTEEPQLRLFSLILTAWRVENDAPQVAMRNLIVLLAGDTDLDQEGSRAARELFPDADDWRDQVGLWTEINQGMPVGPFDLTWHAELRSAAESEGTEP